MIQVDMFEVQLGASLLLQFQTTERRTVRVLADGGKGPPDADIHARLIDAMQSFGDCKRRIDLLVGTHYDADHLDGLLPIINDHSIDIGEAWLPPVANDVAPHALDEALDDCDFLSNQLYSPNGQGVLADYLSAKAAICQFLRLGDPEPLDSNSRIRVDDAGDLPRLRKQFEDYRRQAIRALGTDSEPELLTHADENAFEPTSPRELLENVEYFWKVYGGPRWYHDIYAQRHLAALSAGMLREWLPDDVAARNLAVIRKSAASDAINAISLALITSALRKRSIPVRCQTIKDGMPRQFVWRNGPRRFEGGYQLSEQGPTITLLGPSEGLVRKHWNRLPISVYAEVACCSLGVLKGITPSNQLSYVMRFSAEDQGILVSGDAGCIDFKPKGKQAYYPELLRALSPLHVVQVAHHAGNNGHFYRVLNNAKYPLAQSFLLVSHATHDRHRPSREFRLFVERFCHGPENVRILFTAQPLSAKISDFASLVYPRVGEPSQEGDVRLEFRNEIWEVKKHAIDATADPSESVRRSLAPSTIALATDLAIRPAIKIEKRRERGTRKPRA